MCKTEPHNGDEQSTDKCTCPECSDRFVRIHDDMRVQDVTGRPCRCEGGCSILHFTSIPSRNTHYVTRHAQGTSVFHLVLLFVDDMKAMNALKFECDYVDECKPTVQRSGSKHNSFQRVNNEYSRCRR